MSEIELQSIEVLFEAGIDSSHRAELLEQCSAEVGNELLALWEAHDCNEADGFLEDVNEWHSQNLNLEGQCFDGLEIKKALDQGGMSLVYKAHQSEMQRSLALKTLPWFGVPESWFHLFQVEIATLANLSHPHIATVYHCGKTPNQRPYFTMELIEGAPIDRFIKEQSLNFEDRLELILQLCKGLQYAHGKGVIHRDLKPSNILVKKDGQLKIIDFGIAHSPEHEGPMGGTPGYMSPEQMQGQTCDVTSDIYAVGVLLRELFSNLKGNQLNIREFRHIQAKAVAEDPELRYTDVSSFIRDLEAMLHQLPVLAMPQTKSYLIGKFIRRNKALSFTSVLLFLSLSLGLLFTGMLLQQKTVAEKRVQAVNSIYLDIFQQASPLHNPRDVTAMELLMNASSNLESMYPEQPDLKMTAHLTLGNSFKELNAWEQADQHYSKALEYLESRGEPSSDVRSRLAYVRFLRRDFASAKALYEEVLMGQEQLDESFHVMSGLAQVYAALEENGKACALFEDVIQGQIQRLGKDHDETLATRNNYAKVLAKNGGSHAALRMFFDNDHYYQRKNKFHPRAMIAVHNLAWFLSLNGEKDQAMYLNEDLLERRIEQLGLYHSDTLGTLTNLVILKAKVEGSKSAIAILEPVYRDLHGHADPLLVAKLGQNLGNHLMKVGEADRAETLLNQVLVEKRALNSDAQSLLTTEITLAEVYLKQKRYGKARDLLLEIEKKPVLSSVKYLHNYVKDLLKGLNEGTSQ